MTYKIIIQEIKPNPNYNDTQHESYRMLKEEVVDLTVTDEEYQRIRPLLFTALADKPTS